ncbi:MAG: tRNA (guanosine(37)-N1)-methyltransferase TrmD [Gammaproteobacteria bacterium]
MDVAVVTLFPQMLDAVQEYGVSGRAVRNGLVRISSFNPRDYATDPHRNVDDRPYGGGPGMVMMVQPLRDAIQAAKTALPGARVIYLSPQGRKLDQRAVNEIAGGRELILVAGRYEGVDERFIEQYVDEEWSIGDYVLSGGELAAMVLIDAMARTVPGVLGHDDSAREDSFAAGLLDYPHYTRPEMIDGKSVPQVLLSGDHQMIRHWRMKQALGRTWQRRPDLLEAMELDDEQQRLLTEFKQETLSINRSK